MHRYTRTCTKSININLITSLYIYRYKKKCKREFLTAYIQSVQINLYQRQLLLHLLALKVNFILAFDKDLATTDDGWNISKELSGCDLVCFRVENFLKDDHKMIYKRKCTFLYEAYLICFFNSILTEWLYKFLTILNI